MHYSYPESTDFIWQMNLKLFAARLKLHWNLDPKMEPQKQWWFPRCFAANTYMIFIWLFTLYEYVWQVSIVILHAAMELPKKETALISKKKKSDDNFGPYLPSHDGNSKDVSMNIDYRGTSLEASWAPGRI